MSFPHLRARILTWLRHLALWTIIVVALLVALWVVIGQQLMQRVPDYRHDLELMVEERLRTPLEVGAIHGYMDGVVPVFVLENVQLPAAGGSPARVRRIEVAVDPLPSLWSRTLQTRRLLISGIHLHITRNEEGRLHLKGLEGLGAGDVVDGTAASATASLDAALDLVYRQQRLLIDDASGVVELPGLPRLEVEDLDVALVADGTGYRLGLAARVPGSKARIDLRLALDRRAHRLSELRGNGYLRLRPHGLAPWLNPLLPGVALHHLDGDIEAWLTLRRGQPVAATVRAALTDVALAGAALSRPFDVDGLTLLAGLGRERDGWRLEVPELFLVRDSAQHRLSPLAFHLHDDGAWRLASRELSLAPWRDLVRQLPLREDLDTAPRDMLERLMPSGHLRALAVQGRQRQVERYSVAFDDLRWQAAGRVPGVEGLSGWADGTPTAGLVMLDAPEFGLDLPELFRDPMQFHARGPLRWSRDATRGLTLRSGWLQVVNGDGRGRTVLGVTAPPGVVPRLSLLAGIEHTDARAAPRYIPLVRLSDGVAAWLSAAFRGGTVERGALLYEGPVRIDPARQQDRIFQIGLRARGLSLHYLDQWPRVEQLDADVLIDGRDVFAHDVRGTLLETRLSDARVEVSDDGGDGTQLIIEGALAGPADDLRDILLQTPLRAQLPEEVLDWRIHGGRLQANMTLRMALAGDAPLQLAARGELASVDLANATRRLEVGAFTGPVSFSLADGIRSPGFTATFWDAPVRGRIAASDWRTTIDVSGAVSADHLRAWLGAPWAAPARGLIGYDAVLRLPGASTALEIDVETNLSQLALDLPSPLGRRPGELESATMRFTADAGEQLLRLTVPRLGAGLFRWRDDVFDRGRVELGSQRARLTAEPGLSLGGRVDRLVVSDWVDWFAADDPAQPGTSAAADAPPVPLSLALRLKGMDLFGLELGESLLRVDPRAGGWWFGLDSPQLNGEMIMPADWTPRGALPLTIRIRELAVATGAGAPGAGAGAGDGLDPLDMPVADVSIEQLKLDGAPFGRWSFALRPVPDGTRVEQLMATLPGSAVQGSIDWLRTPAGPRSRFTGSITSSDTARMLRFWEFEPFLEGNDLRLVASLDWAGSPLDVDWLGLHGSASLEIGPARFPKVDPRTSALRVLGVFSNRRLRLDFTDLYRKGLSTDSIGGDFTFDGPRVTTRNLVVSSPSAEFRISGTANLEHETLNHRLEVTLPVSSNLYVGCLAGPAACAGIFMVERLWGDRLEKMTTLVYRLSGTWSQPKLEELQGLPEDD